MGIAEKIKKFFDWEEEDDPASLNGLDAFLNSASEQKISPQLSRKNIENSILELRYLRFHTSNGLLITQDGYFVTALHCMDNARTMTVKNQHGDKYRVVNICETSKEDDLALAKISLEGPSEPIPFNIQLDEKYSLNDTIMLYSRWDGRLVKRVGMLKSANSAILAEMKSGEKPQYFPDQASAKLSVIDGDSGGSIVNQEGQFLGILSSGGKYSAYYTESDNVLRLVAKYADKLKGMKQRKG